MATTVRPTPSLRAAGMRQTPQRMEILNILQESDKPLTVEEIWARMVAESRAGLPTIYRNLERFVQEGWAESMLGRDQIMRFVRCSSRHHHHHIQCEGCGRTAEVDGCAVESAIQGIQAQSGFRVTRHQLQLFGLCPACQAAPPANRG